MKVNFEEKTYESYFNCELDQISSIFFPPGQISEGYLGFDVSAHTKNKKLWKFLGCPITKGVELSKVAQELESLNDKIPKIKANLFIQYKRPEYIISSRAKEWSYWKQKYFRYKIDPMQQNLLETIANKFTSKALVIYAAPAISTINELITCKTKNEIIGKSNFSKVEALKGHSRNTYTRSGTHSKAFSEPEKIKKINIREELNKFSVDNSIDLNKNICNVSETIKEVMYNDLNYKNAFNNLIKEYEDFKEYEIIYYHLIIKSFREITGIQWLVSTLID